MKELSKEEIEKVLIELWGPSITYEELRSRVLSGYAYTIDSDAGPRSLKLHTGKGGVLLYLDTCEAQGAPANLVAKSIIVHTEEGEYPLSKVSIKKKEEDNS